jgi:hypothetical protein
VMLWLDAVDNTARAPNENLARDGGRHRRW